MNKLALLLFLAAAPVFAQSSGLPSTVPGTVGNCVKIGTNNVATDNGSLCGSGSSVTAARYVIYVSAGTTFAQNGSTGAIDFSGTDAGAVINSALTAAQASCGTIYFRNGTYNINTLVAETIAPYSSMSYAIGIPGDTGVAGQQCEWHLVGESATDTAGYELGAAVQTNGVIFNVTSTAVATVASTVLIAGVWQRPNTHTQQGNQDFFKNVTVRFPVNSRGNEVGFYPVVASTVAYENVLADFNTSYCSLAPPVAGTIGSVGITSTQSEQGNLQKFDNTSSVGFDTGYQLMSEHVIGLTMTAAFNNYAAKIGDTFNSNAQLVFHPSHIDRFVDQENLHGFQFGTLMQQGTLFSVENLDLEVSTSSTVVAACPNIATFARVGNLFEANGGRTAGRLEYTNVVAGAGIQELPAPVLFTSGGGSFYSHESTSSWSPATYQDFDNFTGANAALLTAHTSDYGHTWSNYGTISGDSGCTPELNGANAVTCIGGTAANTGASLNSLTPATGTYTASVIMMPISSNAAAYLNVRASNSVNTSYQVGYSSPTGIQLYKIVAGTATQIGTTNSIAWSTGTAHTLAITVGTNSQVVKADGVIISGPQGTDSSITATGQVVLKVSGGGSMKVSQFGVQ